MQKSTELKRRLTTITSLNQIAQAMQVITVVRTKEIQNKMKQAKKFQKELEGIIRVVGLPPAVSRSQPLTQVIIIGTNQGLCGFFNENLIHPLELLVQEKQNKKEPIEIVAIGKRIASDLACRNRGFKAGPHALIEKPSANAAKDFILPFHQGFKTGRAKEVYLVYNAYKSMLIQQPTALKILPHAPLPPHRGNFLIEPAANIMREEALHLGTEITFYICLLESILGELGSRLYTMRNAADNSADLIKQLKLETAKLRQGSITQELTEIMTSFEALKEEE